MGYTEQQEEPPAEGLQGRPEGEEEPVAGSPPSLRALRARLQRPIGLRRETLIILPVALLLLIALSLFTLVTLRGAIERLTEQRQGQLLREGRRAAEALVDDDSPTAITRWIRNDTLAMAILDRQGRTLFLEGALATGAPTPSERLEAYAVGPNKRIGDRIVVSVPFGPDGARRWLRIDTAANVLGGQKRAARDLTWIVVIVDIAVALLLFFYLLRLLAPLQALIERAQKAGGVGGPDGPGADARDEMDLLLETFEQALDALSRQREGTTEIEILERTISSSFESGVLLLDRESRVLALNEVGNQLLEQQVDPAGQPVRQALARYPELAEMLHRGVESGQGLRREEVVLSTLNRGPLALGLTSHPLRRDDGEVRGYLVLFADLTESKRIAEDERIHRSLHELGELSAGVAHELRNSLATLRGYLALVERRPGERIHSYLGEIRTEADHLQRVVDDFLAFARPGSARLETIDGLAVARRAAEDPALPRSAVLVRTTLPAVFLRGDAQLLERALRNLLHNAVEASRSPEKDTAATTPNALSNQPTEPPVQTQPVEPVELHVGMDGDEVRFGILDRGPGIPETIRDRLFEPFVTGRTDGVGLGLALARRIVLLHGGRLELTDREGGGTACRLWLPAVNNDTKSNNLDCG